MAVEGVYSQLTYDTVTLAYLPITPCSNLQGVWVTAVALVLSVSVPKSNSCLCCRCSLYLPVPSSLSPELA